MALAVVALGTCMIFGAGSGTPLAPAVKAAETAPYPASAKEMPPAPPAPPAADAASPNAAGPGSANASYVGSQTCTACHAQQAKDWSGSHHAKAMRHADAQTVQGRFDGATLTEAGVTSRMFTKDGKFLIETDGPTGTLETYEVKFTFGVAPLEQYLVELPGGRLQALPIAWDARPQSEGGQRWFHLYPGQDLKPGNPLHWTGLQQNWNFMCAECHTTNLERRYDAKTRTFSTRYSELNVTCEACHGPGSGHLSWAEDIKKGASPSPTKGLTTDLSERRDITWALDQKTGNSTRSAPRTTSHELDVCGRCHARRGPIWPHSPVGAPVGDGYRVSLLDSGLYFPDGQILDEVFEYGSFLQSRMAHAGVTCSDCHEPHSLKLRAEGNGVCLQCHAADKFAVASHHHHPEGSAGAQCVACHMPERTYMVVDPRRDHSLRIPRPDLSDKLGTPNACTACHADKTPAWAAAAIADWHPNPKPGFQTFGETLWEGTLGAPGARDKLLALASDPQVPGITRASALARLDRITSRAALDRLRPRLADSDPLVRRSAAGAYDLAPPATRRDLLPLLSDPIRDVRLEATRVLAASGSALNLSPEQQRVLAQATEEYIASLRSNADRPEARFNLGLLFVAQGRTPEAEAELKAAIELDPTFAPAVATLADLYRSTGREAEAGTLLKAALASQPRAAPLQHALGLWLVRQGQSEAALSALKTAAELAPEDPRFAYVYAVALNSRGQRPEAIAVLQKLLGRHRYHRDSLYAIATFERDAGEIEAARRYAEELAALEPGDPNVGAFLLQLRR